MVVVVVVVGAGGGGVTAKLGFRIVATILD